jgi:hypothetical protein
VYAAIRSIRNDEPAGYLFAVFLCFGALFFATRSGYALYKLAMYVQPALCATVGSTAAAAVFGARHAFRISAGVAVAVVVLAVNARTQHAYVDLSRSLIRSGGALFVEVPNVSQGRILETLDRFRSELDGHDLLISDTFNQSLGKIESYYARQKAAIGFPSEDMENVAHYSYGFARTPFYDHSTDRTAIALSKARAARFVPGDFLVDGPLHAFFPIDTMDGPNRSKLWLHGRNESPFNRVMALAPQVQSVDPRTKNVVVFVASSIGHVYHVHEDPTALYQLEPDFYSEGRSMSGIGRYLLLEVLNSSNAVRLRISLTESLRGDGENVIPPVSVVGTTRAGFHLRGRGSVSAISDPVIPRRLHGHSYLVLDIGTRPVRFRPRRTGLMNLWGEDIDLDARSLTAFLRDVSALDANAVISVPARLERFPDDLLSSNALYSGLYEDGWASEEFAATLDCGQSGNVVLRGFIPRIADAAFSTALSVRVDGFPITSEQLQVGDVNLPVMAGPGVHRIDWRFSRYQRLPNGDGRPVAMKVTSIKTNFDGGR